MGGLVEGIKTGVRVALVVADMAVVSACDTQQPPNQAQPGVNTPKLVLIQKGNQLITTTPTLCAARGNGGLSIDGAVIIPTYQGVPVDGVVVAEDDTTEPVTIAPESSSGMVCEDLAPNVDPTAAAENLAATAFPGAQPVVIFTLNAAPAPTATPISQ